MFPVEFRFVVASEQKQMNKKREIKIIFHLHIKKTSKLRQRISSSSSFTVIRSVENSQFR